MHIRVLRLLMFDDLLLMCQRMMFADLANVKAKVIRG